MSFMDWDINDEWVEECPRCMTAGVETDELDQMILCSKCNGQGYIPHVCE